jgi:hypothetical protein
MHAEGKYLSHTLKYFGRSVTLVNIKINDQDPFFQILRQQIIRRCGHIVQQAKSLAAVAIRMMGAAGNIQ